MTEPVGAPNVADADHPLVDVEVLEAFLDHRLRGRGPGLARRASRESRPRLSGPRGWSSTRTIPERLFDEVVIPAGSASASPIPWFS
jgi:hypothetical protein